MQTAGRKKVLTTSSERELELTTGTPVVAPTTQLSTVTSQTTPKRFEFPLFNPMTCAIPLN